MNEEIPEVVRSPSLDTPAQAAVQRPEESMGRLPMLTADEQAWLRNLNPAPSDYPQLRVHELIEQQAQATPEAIAVACGTHRLSYAELMDRSNRLAWWLRSQGVGANKLVGLLLPRSVEMMVGLLAIMKAGGAYVPIEPGYPDERIAYMLQDSGICLLLGHSGLRKRLGEALPATLPMLCMDEPLDMAAVDQQPRSTPAAQHLPLHEHLLYVIYTSGSTGRPKAAQVTQRGAMNLLSWYGKQFDGGPSDRALIISALSFDLTQKNLWSPLMLGGTVVLNSGEHYDAMQIVGLIEAERITRINCAPSAFYPLVEDKQQWGRLVSLQQVWLGGEPIASNALWAWHEHSRCRLVNSYGPTECTDVVSWHEVPPGQRQPPIGKPIDNTQLYILDEAMSCCSPGSIGELWVGGDGVGAGYLGRADLTMQRFVSDPFSALAGARLYRTGDLARYLGDGTIEYLGRMDDQVKIRGFRVELGEIEHGITRQEEVKEAVVLAVGESAQRVLRACVVLHEGRELAPQELQARLRAALPEHMVPAQVICLPLMPLTPNGKVDRKQLAALRMPMTSHGKLDRSALPTPDQVEVGSVSGQNKAPLTDDVEKAIHDIWCEVLDLSQINVDEDFFALGGHSLTAAKVVLHLREQFNIIIGSRVLYERPTIKAMSAFVREAGPVEAGLFGIERVQRNIAHPLSSGQEQMWYLDALSDTPLVVPIVLRLSGALDTQALSSAIDGLVARHEALRTKYVFSDQTGDLEQEIVPLSVHRGGALETISIADLQDDEIPALIVADAQKHFSLDAGETLRARLYRRTEAEHFIGLTIHHIAADAWSSAIVLRDLSELYGAERNKREPMLPDLPVQYLDWAVHERQATTGKEAQTSLHKWTARLSGAPTHLPVPDHANATPIDSPRQVHSFIIPRESRAEIVTLANAHHVTPFTVLMVAYQQLISEIFKADDFLVATHFANRSSNRIADVVGFFVNPMILRAQLEPGTTQQELLWRTQSNLVEAADNQGLPLSQVVRAINPPTNRSHYPLLQFVITFAPRPPMIEMPELQVEYVVWKPANIGSDLLLMLEDSPDGIFGTLEIGGHLTNLCSGQVAARRLVDLTRVLTSAPQTGLRAGSVAPSLPIRPLGVLSATGARTEFIVELAQDSRDINLGLMFRDSLPDGTGFLLLLPSASKFNVWMRNTLLPLDLLFIDDAGIISKIVEDAEPGSLRFHRADEDVLAVLKVKGGTASSYGIAVGDQVINFPDAFR